MDGEGRAKLGADELRAVLGAYGIDRPKSAADYRRGQPDAPKALIELADGTKLLLKRRSPRNADRRRVLAAQTAMDAAALGGTPIATLARTKSGERAVFAGGHAYELFEYVDAEEDDRRPAAARESGRVLARTMRALRAADVDLDVGDPALRPGGFHRSRVVEGQLLEAAARVDAGELLGPMYEHAGAAAAEALEDQTIQPLHGDWHPGNLLYRNGRCVAVLDFDAVRSGRPVEELAVGLAQASLPERLSEALAEGVLRLDADRALAFLRGFGDEWSAERSEGEAAPSTAGWAGALPWLVLESLAGEAAGPIARTGTLGPMDGAGVLHMLERSWRVIRHQVARLCERAGLGEAARAA